MNESSPQESTAEEGQGMKWLLNRWVLSGITIVVLVIVLYVEEDWRGAVAWREAQAEIVAAGESLDPNKFIPPPVPDEQNFGALPIFQLESDHDPEHRNNKSAEAMKDAFIHAPVSKIPSIKDSETTSGLPYAGSWSRGESVDGDAVQKKLVKFVQVELPGNAMPSGASPAALFDLLCPALGELRAANETHPYCRFNDDYASIPVFSRSLAGIVSQIGMAKVLSYQEKLALLGNQPELALEDLKVGWKIESGLQQEPNLIAGLVAIGVVAIQLDVVKQGLAQHVWNDQQLAELDADLGKINFLEECKFCIRGEVAAYEVPNLDYLKEHRLLLLSAASWDSSPRSFGSIMDDLTYLGNSCLVLSMPVGWFDDFKAEGARFHLLGTTKMVDPVAHRIYPEKEPHSPRLSDDTHETAYWFDIVREIIGPMVKSVGKFTLAQVQIDEARIACRLERYRLAHGTYPNELKDLVPAYGAELPTDVMNGEPYHYKLLGDGTYQLYSVGWNQKDDGGADMEIGKNQQDAPDWPWGNHPMAKAAH